MCLFSVCPSQKTLPLILKCILWFCILSYSYSPPHLRWRCRQPPLGPMAATPPFHLAPLHSTHFPASSSGNFPTMKLPLFPAPSSVVTLHHLQGKIHTLALVSAVSLIFPESSFILLQLQVYSFIHVHVLHRTTVLSLCSVWQTLTLFQISVQVLNIFNFYT